MNITQIAFACILAIIILRRIMAMRLGKENVKYLHSLGAEKKSDNYVGLVRAMQVCWFLGMIVEVYVFCPSVAYPLAAVSVLVTIFSQAIRSLSAKELGHFWTHPVIVIEGKPVVNTGIYGYIRHPAWLAMGLEFTFVPLIHSAYVTSIVFTVVNLLLSSKRIATEERILRETMDYSALENVPRFIPRPVRQSPSSVGRDGRALVIGSGAAGLAAMNSLQEAKIPFDAVEKHDEIGGLWNWSKADSPVAQNTHAIGHKSMQRYSDLPMPEDYPAYPSNRQILAYLISYAKSKKLYEQIQFNTAVEKVERIEGIWHVTLDSGEVREYQWILLASGQHNNPYIPKFEGEFEGEIIHSSQYKKPIQLTDKKVLVVGAGQSAMDILEDSATSAERTLHSTRGSFYIGNKFILGFPAEKAANFPLIRSIPTPIIFKLLSRLAPLILLLQGINLKQLNIPSHAFKRGIIKPVFNQTIYQYYLQGDLAWKPEILGFDGGWVNFKDGSCEQIDLIVCATGFKIGFPFIEKKLLNWESDKKFPSLYLHCFHPEYDNLFVVGMIQPIGTHWQVFEAQSRLIANYIKQKVQPTVSHLKVDKYRRNFKNNLDRKKVLGNSLVVDKRAYIKQTKKLLD